MVEHRDEIETLEQLLAEVLAGNGRIVLLDGPVASGKTELLRRFFEHSVHDDVVVLNAICSRMERALPFGVMNQLVQNLSQSSEDMKRWTELIDNASTANIGGAFDPETLDREVVVVVHGLCRILLELSAAKSLLLIIDDIRYADPLSRLCLLHLARRTSHARIMILLAGDVELNSTDPSIRADLLPQPNVTQIRLRPLSREAVADTAAQYFDRETARRLTPVFFDATGGNPLLLRATIDDYRTEGELRAEGYGVAFLSCLHRGGSILRRVGQALAVLDTSASPHEIAQLSRLRAETVDAGLRALTSAGLLDDNLLRNQVARDAVLQDLPVADRRDLHRRAAVLLCGRGAPASAVARHLVHAGVAPKPWAVDVLSEAAEQALLDHQAQLAVRCLELAYGSCDDEQERVAIKMKLAQAEWQANPSAAAVHLRPLVDATRTRALDSRTSIELVRQALWHGHTGAAVEALNRLRGAAHDQSTEAGSELRDLEQWLACCYPTLARRRAWTGAAQVAQHHSVLRGSDAWLQAASAMAELLTSSHRRDVWDRAAQVLRGLHLSRNNPWAQEAAQLALLLLIGTDRSDAVAEWCDRLLSEAETRQAPTWAAIFASARADVAVRQGDLSAAVEYARAALSHITPESWGVAIGYPLGTLIVALTRKGDYEEAAKQLAFPVPNALFQTRFGLHFLYARGSHYLETHHHHAALADFLACGELMRTWGFEPTELLPWRVGAAEAWLHLGDRERARQLSHDQMARPAGEGTRTRALSLRVLATAIPAGRRPQLLNEALDLLEAAGDRFEQARVLAELSRVHHALKDNRRARMLFRRAWHLAETCGAGPLSQELLSADHDLSGPVSAVGYPDRTASLTSSERRVASLAVLGYTNREIANKLYITASTVEQHLTRVYRKLNVSSRKELPADIRVDAARSA